MRQRASNRRKICPLSTNPYGVHLNGVAVTPSINGGGSQAQIRVGPVKASSLVQCGSYQMLVFGRDVLSLVSGVSYSATPESSECGTPVSSSS